MKYAISAKDKLVIFKKTNEMKQKPFYEFPNYIEIDKWIITYGVENFQKVAGVSLNSKVKFNLESFYSDLPEFKEVFGEPIDIEERVFLQRGFALLLRYNDFFKNPFFVEDNL